MNPICIYHISDLDGKCSAVIARLVHNCVVETYGIDYGWKFPWDKVKGRDVILVDFTLEPWSDMVKLLEECSHLTWIDHHKTALEMYANWRITNPAFSQKIDGIREIGKAGCELAWQHFIGGEPPPVVRLLGRYDVWDNGDKHAWDSEILPFQYGMRALNLEVDDPYWNTLFYPSNPADSAQVHNIITRGQAILAYENQQNALYAKVCAFETVMAEPIEVGKPCRQLRVIACNKALTNSRLFDSVWDPEKYDLMAAFYLQKSGNWKVSLYTTKNDVDVSVLAKARGGGGHAKAAGFISKELPWWTAHASAEAPGSPQEPRKEVE